MREDCGSNCGQCARCEQEYREMLERDELAQRYEWDTLCDNVIYAYFLDEIDDVEACNTLEIPYARFEALGLAEIERLA